jgi:hypothetical protein
LIPSTKSELLALISHSLKVDNITDVRQSNYICLRRSEFQLPKSFA